MPGALPKCPNGAPPVVRLTLARQKCARKLGGERLRTPDAFIDYLKGEYGCEAQEWFVVVGVDVAGRPLGVHEVALGGMSQTMVDPKVVFSGLLLMGAQAFVVCHNHPSGSTEPSEPDDQLTRELVRGGKILSIRCLDHIIVSGTGHYSYVNRGRMPS